MLYNVIERTETQTYNNHRLSFIHQIPMHPREMIQFDVNSDIGSLSIFLATIWPKVKPFSNTSAVDHRKVPAIIATFFFSSINKMEKSTLIRPMYPITHRWIVHRHRLKSWLMHTTWKLSKETSTRLSTTTMYRLFTLSWLARSWTEREIRKICF